MWKEKHVGALGSGAFPAYNTPSGDVSVFPGPVSCVSGCSYIDFRGVVLIDTYWWCDTSVCNPQTLTRLTKEKQAIFFAKLIHKATRIQDFRVFVIYLEAYLNRRPFSFFLKEQVSSPLSYCLLSQLPPWFGLISLNRDINTISDFSRFWLWVRPAVLWKLVGVAEPVSATAAALCIWKRSQERATFFFQAFINHII